MQYFLKYNHNYKIEELKTKIRSAAHKEWGDLTHNTLIFPNKFAKKQLPYLVLKFKQPHLQKSRHHLINKVYSPPAQFHIGLPAFRN